MLSKIAFNPAMPIVSRAAGGGLVGSINFSISALIQQHIRSERFGTVTGAGGIDEANEAIAGAEEQQEEQRVRAEQGFATQEAPLVVAAKLKLVRDAVQSDLLEHAARKPMATDPSKSIPDPFHIGLHFVDSLDFQAKMGARMPSEAAIRSEARVLGCTEEEVRSVFLSRHNRQLAFLKENRQQIIDLYHGLEMKGADGHAMDIDDAEAVFNNLPALTRLRLLAAADKGLYRARMREVERHLSKQTDVGGRGDPLTNIGLIDGTRRDLLGLAARWAENAEFQASIAESQARGGSLPQFAPKPLPMQKDEKDLTIEKHKRAA